MDEYQSYIGVYLSVMCKHIVLILLAGIKKIAEYVNSNQIEEV